MAHGSKTVVAVVDDLFFTVKIADAAKRAGLQAVFVKTEDSAMQRLAEQPVLMVVDLNCAAIDIVAFLAHVKASEFATVPLIGYVSHVQVELQRKAREAGCETILARSAFSANMPDIFRRYAARTGS